MRWLWLSLALLASLLPRLSAAQSSQVLDVGESVLAGEPLGRNTSILVDESRALELTDVQSDHWARRFIPAAKDVPSFGFDRSAFWARLEVRNSAAEPRSWLLELAYPHLDRVTLFVVHADGRTERRETGDQLPFSQREIEYRHFLFEMNEPAHGVQTYYLRVETAGSVTLPLIGWTAVTFREHQNNELPVLWMFYGLVVVMALYNAFVFVSVREREYLYYCFYVVAYVLTQATLNGHAFQYLVPNAPGLANRLLPFFLGLTVCCAFMFIRRFLGLAQALPLVDQIVRWGGIFSGLLAVYSLFGSFSASIALLLVSGIPLNLVMLTATVILVRRHHRPAQFFAAAWTTFMVGVLLSYLRVLGVVPTNFVSTWAIQIGAAIEVVVLSLALADRINLMRRGLASLNTQLSDSVSELRQALEQAHAATRARGEFLATVSHELRTPLNTIINIPPAVVRDVPLVRVATCMACNTAFALDDGEELASDASCPECAQPDQLVVNTRRLYAGDPSELVENLGMIERAGKHLLEMVNGILDFSKLGAGRLELRRQPVSLASLTDDVVGSLRELARRGGVQLVCAPIDAELTIEADALRLKQVLINLIGNAIKFSDGRGVVEVGARAEPDSCVLYVKDQGIGIAPENVYRIFSTFEQVEQGDTRKYGGTGLGLSISKSLVELHGGQIWVESQPGQGATFYVRIPSVPVARRSVAA